MSEAAGKRGHILVVTKSDDWHPDQHDYDFAIECVEPDLCNGWWECREEHGVDGLDADLGPYDADAPEDAPWYDEDEFEFHGVMHTWRYSAGWTVPFPGCVVAAQGCLPDEALNIAHAHGEGRHVVDDEWGDPGELWLHYVVPADTPAEVTP